MLGIPKGSLENWIRWEKAGVLACTKDQVVSPEQMELTRLRAELSRVKMERDILKKGDGVFRERVPVKFTWIDRNKTQWPIALACKVLSVSASRYFQHQRRKKSVAVNNVTCLTRLSDWALLVQIRAIQAEERQE